MKKPKFKKPPATDGQEKVLPEKAAQDDLLVVGIGASAGGIQALRQFFQNVPADGNIAYIVILHLSPDHDSKLAEVLQVVCKIPVARVFEEVAVQPNQVYVVSPNHHLAMSDNRITVSPNTKVEERRAPVDIFFRTLAESHHSRAVAVILSGTGANGSMGLKRIKERGGAAFVQNPREAEFNEMPRNAIATELVDEVLPVADIPAKIIAYKKSLGTVEIAVETEKRSEEQQQALREIFTQLRFRTGHDFSNYKRPTLLRRIERRINVRNLPDLSAYAAYVNQHPEETQALLRDLLISVTNFFRDEKAFEAIEREILPRILQDKKPDQALRIWVAGCATGEEAYSLAMLCAEKTMGVLDAPRVQIFATDIDETAVAIAREGLYTLNDCADVSPERLRRFFNKEGNNYRVRRELREMVLFAMHNVLKDPPFSHLDLVTCRNMLIYLNTTAQERVMETFHFALNPGSYLFLGGSESADMANDLFASVNREFHIYQSRHVASRTFPIPESVPHFKPEKKSMGVSGPGLQNGSKGRLTYADLHQQLLEQFAPPSVVVNEEYEILHLSEHAGLYLQVTGGEPSQNLLKLVRPELRLELRTALYQAVQRKTNVEARNITVIINSQEETINIHVRPVLREADTARGFLLVLFEKTTSGQESDQKKALVSEEPMARHLEEELVRVKNQLRSSTEQHELQAEELKASNEELQAMNEELRSSAEELETSKEELQSMNEELSTVNQELKVKIEETTMSNNNFQNLMNSTDIATIFLDRSFRVNLFTPAARSIFNLIPSDFGRPISDITNKLEYQHLLEDAVQVLDKLQTMQREVKTSNGNSYLMRILPYRTGEDRIDGVVITFIDITERKLAEERLLQSEADFRATFEISSVGKTLADPYTGRFLRVNNALCGWLGYAETELLQKTIWDITHPDDVENSKKVFEDMIRERTVDYRAEKRYIRKNGDEVWGDVAINRIRNSAGEHIRVVAVMQDITERKRAEEGRRQSEARFRTLADSVPQIIWTNESGGKAVYFNKRWFEYSGLNQEQSAGPGWQAIVHPEDMPASVERWQQALSAGVVFESEYRLRRSDGIYRWHIGRNVPLHDNKGQVVSWFGTATDIDDLKSAETSLRESRERFRVTMESATDFAIITTDQDGLVQGWNSGAEYIFGYTEKEICDKSADVIFTPEDRAAGVPQKEMQQAREEGRAGDERWHLRKDGSRFYMSGVMTPIRSNIIKGYVKIARDMTEQKKAEETLRISEERYRIALQASEMGAWDWNIMEDKVLWNEQLCLLLGLKLEQTENNIGFFLQYVHLEDRERIQFALTKAVYETGIFQAEFRIVRADSSQLRWMSGYARTVATEDNQASRIVGVMYDVTTRKMLEQQKDEFIGIASHELKTPVTSIKAYVEVLNELFEEGNVAAQLQLVKKLDIQVDRLTELIRTLLDTTKMSEGQLTLNLEEFNVSFLIKERVEEVQGIARNHRLLIKSVDVALVTADRDRIGQALMNLLSNAVKYSPNGGDIIVTCDLMPDGVQVGVRDPGIGMSEEAAAKVFERFFRVRNQQTQALPGMGLGLYITAGIIRRHGGTIWVESKPGKGAVFYFKLPFTVKQPKS